MPVWSENLEDLPRLVSQEGFTFSSPTMARKGDLWTNPSRGIKEQFIVEYVTKWVHPEYSAIWYIVTFSNPSDLITSLHIGEGMGMGTFTIPVKQNA
jgi:hypothetical protein